MASQSDTKNLALFCDFENVALGVRDARYAQFDIKRVLERLLLKGSIVVKKAYCDWERYKEFKGGMHEAAFELIEIPHVRMSGKNSADIRMVVDALDLCYTKAHVDTFVIISGDSDFSPLVSKLRENNKTVIGVGVKQSTSDLLMSNCDEFIFYDDLVREDKNKQKRTRRRTPAKVADGAAKAADGSTKSSDGVGKSTESTSKAADAGVKTVDGTTKKSTRKLSERLSERPDERPDERAPDRGDEPTDEDKRQDALDLLLETVEALIAERGEEEKIWGSMVKQTLKRRKPGFNESYYGYRAFSDLLEDARDRGLLTLERDEKSGGYIIRMTAAE